MRVLLISPLALPAGGIATWTELYLKSEKVLNGEIKVDLVNSNVGGERVKAYSKKSIFSEISRCFRIFKDLKKFLKSNNYEIVHLNNSCSTLGMLRDYLLGKYIKIKKQKLLVHFHCDVPVMVKGKLGNFLLKKICEIADKRIVLNESSQQFLNEIKFESYKLPNFFDLKSIKYEKRIHKEEIKKIVFVGHVVATKGCNEIIEVAKSFKDIEFRLVGNIGEEFKNRAYDENVKLVGEVSKESVIQELKEADVMLFPSHTEGFPNVIMEAMAVELPIIATRVGAIPDMIESGGGLLLKTKNIKGIKNGLESMKNSKIRCDMGIWNLEKVRRDYILDNIIDKLIKVYMEDI